MEERIISVEEIHALRQKAEAERETRRQIQQEIMAIRHCLNMSEKRQMEILVRGHSQEIMPMLEAYRKISKKDPSFTLCEKAQLYLYKKRYGHEVLRTAWIFMQKNLPLCYSLEVQLIHSRDYTPQQRLSEKAECFLLESRLKDNKCFERISGYNFFGEHFKFVLEYINKFCLCPKAEAYLVREYLNVTSGSDSYIDSCHKLVSSYLRIIKQLPVENERILIASGVHKLIMEYIQLAPKGLQAEKELLHRGDREEITAYFDRYAKL